MFELIFAILLSVMPVCAEEDSLNCAYDASTQGNGSGSSFVTFDDMTIYRDGSIITF